MDSSTIVPIIISLISGSIGGNIAGALLRKFSLGPICNTIVGLLGGMGQMLIAHLTTAVTTGGIGMVANVGGSAVGGAILIAIMGAIKNAATTKTA